MVLRVNILLLIFSFITPTALFYVRNHLPVPDVDPQEPEHINQRGGGGGEGRDMLPPPSGFCIP